MTLPQEFWKRQLPKTFLVAAALDQLAEQIARDASEVEQTAMEVPRTRASPICPWKHRQ
jgi:hypothetical protein